METATYTDVPSAAIMILNDDCLEHIVRLLPFPDRFHFALTCTRFQNFYEQVSPVLDKCLKFYSLNDMKFEDIIKFFTLCGCHVREIEWELCRYERHEFFDLIGITCVNLRSLMIKKKFLQEYNMTQIFRNLKQLQSLQLTDCNMNDECLLELMYLSQLKKLDLSQNDKLTGHYMQQFPSTIETLNLSLCFSVNANLLPIICKGLPQLKELHINGIHTKSSFFRKLVSEKACESLETITISVKSDDQEYEHIARLPSIRKIVLHTEFGMFSFAQVRSEFLMMLVNHKATQLNHFEVRGPNSINSVMALQIGKLVTLQTLVLPMNDAIGDREMEALTALHGLEKINLACCRNVSNDAVLRLILACPKLKMVHLGGCPNITGNLLTSIVYKLKLESHRKEIIRPLPIRIIVNPKARAALSQQTLNEGILIINGKDINITNKKTTQPST